MDHVIPLIREKYGGQFVSDLWSIVVLEHVQIWLRGPVFLTALEGEDTHLTPKTGHAILEEEEEEQLRMATRMAERSTERGAYFTW